MHAACTCAAKRSTSSQLFWFRVNALYHSQHASSSCAHRKAYRLGKFLQDVNNMRKSNATGHLALLELVAYGGEGVYYFIEQIVW